MTVNTNELTLDDPTIKRLGELAASIAASTHLSSQQAMSILIHALGWKVDRDEALAAVDRVRQLHSREDKGWGEPLCKGCQTEVTFAYWPCATIRALDETP